MSKQNNYWIRNASKIRKIATKTLPIYERIGWTYTTVDLPTDFWALVSRELGSNILRLPYHDGGSGNMFNGLMPTLAIMASVHVVLTQAGWTPEQIGRLNYDTYYAQFRRLPAPVRGLMRLVMVSPLLAKLTRKATRAMRRSDRSDAFLIDYSFSRNASPCTTMECTRCGMVTYMQDNGLSAMRVYCNVFDYAQADACGMGLVQHRCIGTGDATCMYHITRSPEDTRYPAQLSRILELDMSA